MPRSAKGGSSGRLRVCFVTGTRAEFGLMRTTLAAIRGHPKLQLQIVCTGMHLDPAHGRSIDTIRAEGWKVDAVVPWRKRGRNSSDGNAAATGYAMAGLAEAYERLRTDVVLVVGDRVEAFAAAAAAHVARRFLAHVHGGDRALGQVDDSLRHAITKLANLHFPATTGAEERIRRLGEDPRTIHRVGSPGIDGIRGIAASTRALRQTFPGLKPGRFALLLLHPTGPVESTEHRRAAIVFDAVQKSGVEQAVIVYPNNDPGAAGIIRCWEKLRPSADLFIRRDVPRSDFLGLLGDAAVLVGNSSSGIIEAATFGTRVVDVGPRQAGRERGANVTNVPFEREAILKAVMTVWNNGHPRRDTSGNVYGGGGAGARIARILARLPAGARAPGKLIAY
jgi:UDP-hydrolysing UDP-N-acetyl-D-glucosamine 2-epimerase